MLYYVPGWVLGAGLAEVNDRGREYENKIGKCSVSLQLLPGRKEQEEGGATRTELWMAEVQAPFNRGILKPPLIDGFSYKSEGRGVAQGRSGRVGENGG